MNKLVAFTFVFGATLMLISSMIVVRAYNERCLQDRSITERNRVYLVERGAEDDVADLALSEHQEVNYTRCYLRAAGHLTCRVHTPPADVEATCRARRNNELLVDGARCRWTNPETMAHP